MFSYLLDRLVDCFVSIYVLSFFIFILCCWTEGRRGGIDAGS